MLNLVLFGPPGAGKGTQSQKLVEKYHLVHVSPGSLFRKHIQENTPLGRQVQAYMTEGKLVPDKIVLGMIEEQLGAHPESHGFLFDGFPRTTAQAKALDKKLIEHESTLSLVIALEVPKKELQRRIRQRKKELQRTDDQNDETITTRFDIYFNETLPVAAYYKKQGKFFKISGIDPVNIVLEQISALVSLYDTSPYKNKHF